MKQTITVQEYIRLKALGLLGLISSGIDPRSRDERLVFVNNLNEIKENTLQEHNIWYHGDSSEIKNFFTRANAIDYNADPLYNRNKRSYFWAVSSTEGDIKCTHSGQPRNIVDTLVGIIGTPMIGVGKPNAVLEAVDKKLKKILKDNRFCNILVKRARPLTLVEGWGAWKINWNNNFRDTPIILYYRADAVDFIYNSNQLIGIIYKDYYQDDKKNNYILFETRYVEKRKIENGVNAGMTIPCLIIDKDVFKVSGTSEVLLKCELKDIPQLKDINKTVIVENCDCLLGAPNIYFEDSTEDLPGRSVYTGKEDLFDDLDQCLSQAANSVRRSTPTEVWDVNYLEVDNNGMPVMPKAYDRKYIQFRGARSGDGSVSSNPVQTTQPAINFSQYDSEAISILLQIVNGLMSPATLGIDIAKKDNGESMREKEKITIFTRNLIIEQEQETLIDLCRQVLIAEELQRTGTITCTDYDIFVKYNEFADASFESKIESVISAYQGGIMTPEMAVRYLYGDNLSDNDRKDLIGYMKAEKEKSEQGPYSEEELGMMGAEMGGMNPYDEQVSAMNPDISAVKEKLGTPELGNYGKLHNRAEQTDIQKMTHDKIKK